MSRQTSAVKGVVYLVGAGPGDPELLTVKAVRLLATADVVLHDDLVPEAVLAQVNPRALVTSVGKRCKRRRVTQQEIHAMMIDSAQRGLSVVRLKSGDPMVFGRAGEEMDALRAAGVAYEIVPGITAAFAAASAVQASLSDRRVASKIILLTAHHAAEKEKSQPLWQGELPADATLAVYMPGSDYAALQKDLLAAGVAPQTPCIAVSCAGTAEQRMQRASLEKLSQLAPAPAPVVLLIGEAMAAAQMEAQPQAVAAEVAPLVEEAIEHFEIRARN
jgi:uroporphyrin-III C-methyltransferase